MGRQTALLASFEVARKELARAGRHLDIKVVHRISLRVGLEVLTARKGDLKLWRSGQLAKGSEFARKRVGIAMDGARSRIREGMIPQCGRGKKKRRRRRWTAQWREPKCFVIFELAEDGRMKRGTRAFIDGTLQGPDALMELLAMRLYQLGVSEATEVVFLADGGTWIWNRLPEVIRKSGLATEKIFLVLDFYHAVNHVNLATKALRLSSQAQGRVFRRLRRQLYNGQVDLLLNELKHYCKISSENQKKDIQQETDYFERHRLHMDYRSLRENGRPMGSGAIESTIRRVINQRLKGNGIMWKAENAEALMAERAAVVSGRWEETLEHARASMATDRRIDWQWSSPDMRNDDTPDEQDHAKNVIISLKKAKKLPAA